MVLMLIGSLAAGCGASQPALDRSRLNLELSFHVSQGQLTAHIQQLNGSVMLSNPLMLNTAIQNPAADYGTLLGPAASWTLVFGAVPPRGSERVFVNGHRAAQKKIKSGYIVWEYFLPGDVSHPTVKTKSSNP